jgi:hypothetical protein
VHTVWSGAVNSDRPGEAPATSTVPSLGPDDVPWIISVDDHVTEPPDVWTSRLPRPLVDRAPRVERDRARFHWAGGVFSFDRGIDDGQWCDFWVYEGVNVRCR